MIARLRWFAGAVAALGAAAVIAFAAATDAAAQVPPNTGPNASWSEWAEVKKRQAAYKAANASSATQGMYVLEKTGDLAQALRKTQEVFRSYGFEVRQTY